MRTLKLLALAGLALGTQASAQVPQLRFIGEKIINNGTVFSGTTVGGLSGIDYDPTSNSYIALSDDRSQINPARYYTLTADYNLTAFNDVTFTSTTPLQTSGGENYPALDLDPESIRFAPNGNLVYTSEGSSSPLRQPFVREMQPNGTFVRDFTIPALFNYDTATNGARNNLMFESLTFNFDRTKVITATENALAQDGLPATILNGTPNRVLEIDWATGNPGAQYVYVAEPVQDTPIPINQFATNGLVEMLNYAPNEYLMLERSFSTGILGNDIRLYYASTFGATDVSSMSSLAGQVFNPMTKQLILDFDDILGLVGSNGFDNIEGITFGKTLENGNPSLLLVSDNNFSSTQFTQFLAFEIVPEPSSLLASLLGSAALLARRRRV